MKNNPKLTLKQELFVRAYIRSKGNASLAYREAYNTDNMQEGSINTEACLLKQAPKISQRIKELEDDLYATIGVTTDYILTMLKKSIDKAYAKKDYSTVAKLVNELNKMANGHDPRRPLDLRIRLSSLTDMEEKEHLLLESVEDGLLSFNECEKLSSTICKFSSKVERDYLDKLKNIVITDTPNEK